MKSLLNFNKYWSIRSIDLTSMSKKGLPLSLIGWVKWWCREACEPGLSSLAIVWRSGEASFWVRVMNKCSQSVKHCSHVASLISSHISRSCQSQWKPWICLMLNRLLLIFMQISHQRKYFSFKRRVVVCAPYQLHITKRSFQIFFLLYCLCVKKILL